MNIKMAIISQLSTIESKKQMKQTSRTETILDMEIIWRVVSWEEEGKNGGKGAEIDKYKLVDTEKTGGC